MAINLPIYSKKLFDSLSSKGPGKYRLYLKDVNFGMTSGLAAGYTATTSGNVLTILERTENVPAKEMQLVVEVKPDPAQVNESGVNVGLIVVLGLIGAIVAAGAFTIDKVEKIIETPGGQAALIGGSLLIVAVICLGIYGLYRFIGKKT